MTDSAATTIYRCDAALIDEHVRSGVDIHCAAGVITDVNQSGIGEQHADVQYLPGLVVPGFADAHSHVFHRALRGRTHDGTGTFWTWRDRMYELAGRLNPDGLRDMAFAGYLEMLCAGYTAVGEFHYLHHQPDGRPYDDPNAMGLAVADAADLAGVSLTLIDVAYLAGGFGRPVAGVQQRFSDRTVQGWVERVSLLPAELTVGIGMHSVRAVPPADLPVIADAAAGRVLHVHLSEQIAENAASLEATGLTPTMLLAEAGALGPGTAAVHATHLTDADIRLLGGAQSSVVVCPTTEADLADGLPAAAQLDAAGAKMALGGDQHVVVDPFAQARGLEYGERLRVGRRGAFTPATLWRAALENSHAAISSPGGVLAVGAPADLVALRTDSARTAGARLEQLVMCATAQDVDVVVVAGLIQARAGKHVTYGDPGPLLAAAVARAWG